MYYIIKNGLTATLLFFSLVVYSQTGVVTSSPDASLHVEAINKANPSGSDGVLIPRMADYPGNGIEKGQLIYLLNHPTDQEGFYFWDGTTWVWLINNYERTIDVATYVASGSGYTGTGNNRVVNFSRIDAYDPTGFAVAANNVTVGKTGKYLVTFTTSAKRTSTVLGSQANFTYVLYVNGNQLPSITGSVTASTSNEAPSSTSAAMSTIVDLNQGDVLRVDVNRSNEDPQAFIGYGINGLTLTFLR
ncbi:hypothetical protein ACFSKL_22235 [Belliella marina]|uniref:C1q domain-containing protein n=1 Tax=Belliella marina TaxID=1644146 RepID=A0ABW4VTJ6_9BACT